MIYYQWSVQSLWHLQQFRRRIDMNSTLTLMSRSFFLARHFLVLIPFFHHVLRTFMYYRDAAGQQSTVVKIIGLSADPINVLFFSAKHIRS